MTFAITALLALVLLSAPRLAALPDDTVSDQPLWSSWLSALVMAAALLGMVQAWKARAEGPTPARSSSPLPKREGKQRMGQGASRGFRGGQLTAGPATEEQSRPLTRAVPPPETGGVPEERGWGGFFSPVTLAFLTLLGLAALSLVWRLVAQRHAAYLGLMLHGWATLATQFALFVLCRRVARASRTGLYALLLAALGGSALIGTNGLIEYLLHWIAGDREWRVFSFSTPDFLAGYLVMLLPPTLALLLTAPRRAGALSPLRGRLLPALLTLVVLVQTITLLTTGSRFALISGVIAALVFGLAWRQIRAARETGEAANGRRLAGAGVGIVLIGLLFVFARPVVSRLTHSPTNSGAFRVWTWRGAARMAAANPLLGTGVGAWVDQYPPYALTGFTRLAHNSYLQMADECGLPALAALLATLGLAGVAARRALSVTPKQPPETSALLDTIAPADDRLLQCGLLAGLAAGVTQNLIDSDWYVFFLGVTFWALAGLAVGVGDRAGTPAAPTPVRRLRLILSGGVAAVLLILFGTQGMAAFYNGRAQRQTDPAAAQRDYAQAQAWDPLNARHPGDLGYRIYYRVGNLAAAETSLRAAVAMEPNGLNFQRLATILEAQGRRADALAAFRDGLRVDPNKLDLLLGAARLSSPPEALGFYRKVASLEVGPVGRVRAIGELTEVKFAEGDAALAQAAAQAGDSAGAARYGERAARVLEAYADEGGTANGQRQVLAGFHPRPEQDRQYRDLYTRVMAGWVEAGPPDQKLALQSRAYDYGMRFRAILAQDYATLGNDAGASREAVFYWSRAAEFLQSYADEGGSRGGQRQGLTDSRPDPERDARMRALYAHVMDRLSEVSPPGGRAAIAERERVYLAKFAGLFPPR